VGNGEGDGDAGLLRGVEEEAVCEGVGKLKIGGGSGGGPLGEIQNLQQRQEQPQTQKTQKTTRTSRRLRRERVWDESRWDFYLQFWRYAARLKTLGSDRTLDTAGGGGDRRRQCFGVCGLPGLFEALREQLGGSFLSVGIFFVKVVL